MNGQPYLITANTHLHAGSGNTNAGAIDNLVQRDPADGLPCIYASSLKGAFREYFEESIKDLELADTIFGKGDNKRAESGNAKGSHIFHQASLLSIPVRSNQKPFYNATSPSVIQKFLDEFDLFTGAPHAQAIQLEAMKTLGDKPKVYHGALTHLRIEEFSVFDFNAIPIPQQIKDLLGENPVVLSDADFAYQCGDLCLPVIARNNLENGESKNLWYEQIVPRQARFWFYTVCGTRADKFDELVNGKQVQIGANASIGYGVCEIKKL